MARALSAPSSTRPSVLRARRSLFLSYVVLTALGAGVGFIAGDAFRLGPIGADGAFLLERLQDGSVPFGPAVRAWIVGGILMLLVSPFLQLSWLAELDRPEAGLSAALKRGAEGYLRAWGIALAVGLVTAVSMAIVIAPGVIAAALAETERGESLALLSVAVPAALLLSAALTWNDLARAELSLQRATVRRSLASGLRAFGAKAWTLYLLSVVAARIVAFGGGTLAVMAGDGAIGVVAGAALQLVVVLRLGIRGLWLAKTVTWIRSAPVDSPAPEPSP
ncbi:MAG: hypothetical protein AAGF12_04355 [Myxococcota bacterium]